MKVQNRSALKRKNEKKLVNPNLVPLLHYNYHIFFIPSTEFLTLYRDIYILWGPQLLGLIWPYILLFRYLTSRDFYYASYQRTYGYKGISFPLLAHMRICNNIYLVLINKILKKAFHRHRRRGPY